MGRVSIRFGYANIRLSEECVSPPTIIGSSYTRTSPRPPAVATCHNAVFLFFFFSFVCFFKALENDMGNLSRELFIYICATSTPTRDARTLASLLPTHPLTVPCTCWTDSWFVAPNQTDGGLKLLPRFFSSFSLSPVTASSATASPCSPPSVHACSSSVQPCARNFHPCP